MIFMFNSVNNPSSLPSVQVLLLHYLLELGKYLLDVLLRVYAHKLVLLLKPIDYMYSFIL